MNVDIAYICVINVGCLYMVSINEDVRLFLVTYKKSLAGAINALTFTSEYTTSLCLCRACNTPHAFCASGEHICASYTPNKETQSISLHMCTLTKIHSAQEKHIHIHTHNIVKTHTACLQCFGRAHLCIINT
jgi:hypothetical protein